MSEAPLVREFRADDFEAVARLFDAYRQFYEEAPDLTLAREYLDARISHGESVILVACDGAGDIHGFCQLYPSFCSVAAAPIYVLYDLFVREGERRHGYARALMLAAAERGRRDGRARLDLSTARSNARAQALYESLGWRRDEVFYTYSLDLAPGGSATRPP